MDRTSSRDGTSIAYRTRGDGPPVILVGGALSTAATEAPLAALLVPRFTVLTYDRRGRGTSGDSAGYTVRREIEDLAAVAERVGGCGPVSVFGMLSGGALALEAQAAGLPVDLLAVYQPPYTPGAPGPSYKARCTARLHRMLSIGGRGGAVELYLSRTGVPDATIARMQESLMWPGLKALAHTLVYDDTLLGNGSVPAERFASVTARTLAICGGFSPTRVHTATRMLAEAVPRARHRTLTGQARVPAPQVIAPVLADFFTRDVYAGRMS